MSFTQWWGSHCPYSQWHRRWIQWISGSNWAQTHWWHSKNYMTSWSIMKHIWNAKKWWQDQLSRLKSVKNKKKRATQVIRTSTNDWLTCLLDTWVTHKHIILSYTINLSITMATSTTIKVVTSITISSLGVVTIITNKESFPNFVIKSDTQQKSIDLNWGLLLHSIDLKQTIGL